MANPEAVYPTTFCERELGKNHTMVYIDAPRIAGYLRARGVSDEDISRLSIGIVSLEELIKEYYRTGDHLEEGHWLQATYCPVEHGGPRILLSVARVDEDAVDTGRQDFFNWEVLEKSLYHELEHFIDDMTLTARERRAEDFRYTWQVRFRCLLAALATRLAMDSNLATAPIGGHLLANGHYVTGIASIGLVALPHVARQLSGRFPADAHSLYRLNPYEQRAFAAQAVRWGELEHQVDGRATLEGVDFTVVALGRRATEDTTS